jgi:2-dehydropantoate 2-reductase
LKVAVIGAGAMGSLFGARMAEAGTEVWLHDVWAEHVLAINENGLSVEFEGELRQVFIRATVDPIEIGSADLVLIFVKSTDTRTAAQTAGRVAGPGGLVLTLQNGIGNPDVISGIVGPDRVLAGTTAHGATLLGPGRIRHAGAGPTVIGSWGACVPDKVREIADLLSVAGILTETTRDVRSALWRKLIVNVGINAITALTGIKNGQILDLETTRSITAAAVREAVAVAETDGIEVMENAVEHVFRVAEATGGNRSSMGQDVDNHRQTEIAAINGAVVEKGRILGIETPVNRTLAALIETLQAHYF